MLASRLLKQICSRSVSSTCAPLDIFLVRAHALPLPYVAIPSISFLVYLSPLAYLTLRRTCPTNVPPLSNTALPALDIPFQHLRACMATRPRPPGATIATLVIANEGPSLPVQTSTMSMEALAARPTFILHEAGAKVDAVFSLPLDAPGAFASYRWFLDFTDGGKHPGVVMSQSRMREIETIVNPLGTGFSPVDAMPLLGLVSGSWVDLLVCRALRDKMSCSLATLDWAQWSCSARSLYSSLCKMDVSRFYAHMH